MAAAIINADELGAKLSDSFRSLAKLTGYSDQTVTQAELSVILKTCISRTKIAPPEAIEVNTRRRVLGKGQLDLSRGSGPESVTINSGARGPAGRVWWRTTSTKFQLAGQASDDGQKFTPANRHFKFTHWLDIKDAANDYAIAMRRALPLARQSAGLARQSWVQIADDLALPIDSIPGGASPAAIAKARAAIASDGKTYRNGIGTERSEQNKSYVATIVNQLPYWPRLKLDSVLSSVIAGRVQYFQRNIQKAVLASHAQTVRAYPWLKVVGYDAEPR